MLYPHLLIGLQLADGGYILDITAGGDVLVSHGVRVQRRTFHSLDLSHLAAAELLLRLGEVNAIARAQRRPTPPPRREPIAAHPGDLVVLEQQQGRYLRWEISSIDPGDDGVDSQVNLVRGNERQTLSWAAYCAAYSGHIERRRAS